MIGSAKITYTNENVCELVRKDLVDKFGNRELANYNLYLPGVIRGKADIKDWPSPDVKITSVEDQIKEMGIVPKPMVPRNPDSVKVLPDLFGSQLSSTFDYRARRLVVDGVVAYTSAEMSEQSESAHWYGVEIAFPYGFVYEMGDIIPYTMNGEPLAHVVTNEEEDNHVILILCDGKFTSMDLRIHWDDNYGAEHISILCNATLESKAIDKIPVFPTQPKFEFDFSEKVTEANVQVDVDLDMGKN